MCQAVSCQVHRGSTVFSVASPVLTSWGDIMWSQQAEKSPSISLYIINASMPHNWFTVFRLAQGLCSSWLHSNGCISTCCIWGSRERQVCLSSISRSLPDYSNIQEQVAYRNTAWIYSIAGLEDTPTLDFNTPKMTSTCTNECFREILILVYGHFRGCRFWRWCLSSLSIIIATAWLAPWLSFKGILMQQNMSNITVFSSRWEETLFCFNMHKARSEKKWLAKFGFS